MLRDANKELVKIARQDEPSVLRDRTYGGLSKETCMFDIVNKLLTKCPTVSEILSSLLDCSLLNPGKKLAPICLIYSIIMFMRCHELRRIQRINTVLTEGKVSSTVSIRLICIQKRIKIV